MNTRPILLGTAGHIDHGKTSLVKSLTGIDCDRLKVEKERGITTELGFAHLKLGKQRFGLIDVPGHERFIKAMVAGAGGLDLVILVIAADEGVMPQTREHLDICQLLGVKRGVVALTKSDLVDPDWVELVTHDIRETLRDTFLFEAPIIPVSSKSGKGLDVLRQEISKLAKSITARSSDGSLRLPIDRVFTVKGFGTVVTGTVISGKVREGDLVTILPVQGQAKVRGLEVHEEKVSSASAGMRAAVNLAGIDYKDIHRGNVVTLAEAFAPSHIIDVRFQYLRTSQTKLSRRSKVLIHHGTAQHIANLVLRDKDSLEPGEEALAQIRVNNREALSALPGDRFIARGFVVQKHYGTTLGGGEVLRVHAPKVRSSNSENLGLSRAFADAQGNERVALEVKAAQVSSRTLESLQTRLGLNVKSIQAALGELIRAGEIVRAGDHYCHAESLARIEKKARDLIAGYAKANPSKRGIPKAELRSGLPNAMPLALFNVLLGELVDKGQAEVDQDVIKVPGGERAGLSPTEQRIAEKFKEWGLTPKRPKDASAEFDLPAEQAKQALEKLVTRGQLTKVKSDLLVHKDSMTALRAALNSHFESNDELSPGDWKALTQTSRKFSIPLAEYFDQERVTLRVGDIRKKRA